MYLFDLESTCSCLSVRVLPTTMDSSSLLTRTLLAQRRCVSADQRSMVRASQPPEVPLSHSGSSCLVLRQPKALCVQQTKNTTIYYADGKVILSATTCAYSTTFISRIATRRAYSTTFMPRTATRRAYSTTFMPRTATRRAYSTTFMLRT